MPIDRAYTRVSGGTARLGNAWCERVWSTFLGHTIEVHDAAGDFEWCAGDSPEFRISLPNRVLGVMDFGEVEWMEEANPHGAALVSRHTGEGMVCIVHTLALHESPGMLRTLTLINTGASVVAVAQPSSEVLELNREEVVVHTNEFKDRSAGLRWKTAETAAALVRPDRGLFFGMEGGGVFELFAPDPATCAAVAPGTHTLPPGARWTAPSTFLLFFKGSLERAVARDWPAFRRKADAWREWERERQT